MSNSLICDVAATCGMHHVIRFFSEDVKDHGRARRKMLADSFEAFLGALFLAGSCSALFLLPLGVGYVASREEAVALEAHRAAVEREQALRAEEEALLERYPFVREVYFTAASEPEEPLIV